MTISPPSFSEMITLSAMLAQIIGVFGMFSVIWLIQIVVYPSFLDINTDRWQDFHHRHCRRMGFIAGSLMCAELFGATTMCFVTPIDGFAVTLLVTSILTWLATGIIFVPLHRSLRDQKDDLIIHNLIKQNWSRTVIWSISVFVWISRAVYYLLIRD